jgi:hypothetical protein
LFALWLKNPIAEIETWASQESINIAWPPDAVQYYNHGVRSGTIQRIMRDDMVLTGANRPVMASVFVGVIDAVRTRILELALEIEKVAPSAGQPGVPADVKGQAAQVVSNYNFYGTSNVAINSRDVTQTVQLPKVGDEEGLLRYLGAAGVHPENLVALRDALAADRSESEPGNQPNRWSRTRAWFARASTDVGTNAIGGAITAAGEAFLGS